LYLALWKHPQAEKTINAQQLQTAVSAARNALNNSFGIFGDPFRLMELQQQPKEHVTHTVCYTDVDEQKPCNVAE
jgi:hypothetical protein